MKKFESKTGIEKRFIHVRVNTSGSPLERSSGVCVCICLLLNFWVIHILLLNFVIFFLLSTDTFPSIGRVRVKHRGILLMLKGTVIRSGAVKMYEGERMFRCRKCKHM